METIIIKEIVEKDTGLVIVKYNGNREATLNKKWQSEEVEYLKQFLLGSVSVEIVTKGQYINITKVDMSSGVENVNVPSMPDAKELTPEQPKVNMKDERITAAVLLKGAIEMCKTHTFANLQDESKYICECINELNGAYKYALTLL